MNIVIDISDRIYSIVQNKPLNIIDSGIVEKAIANGTPLPNDAIIIDAKEQSDYVFVEKAKYNDLVEAASKALTDRIKKSLYEGGTDDNDGMLEQQSILDKIRAEIDSHCSDNRDRNDGLYIAMKIIDKYKSESEGKE